jgi:hypothetical protein
LTIKVHSGLLIATQILIFVPVIGFWVAIHRGWHWLHQALVLAPLFIAAAIAPFMIFGHLIPARCPKPGCGGKTFPGFPKPPRNSLIYRCSRCSHEHDTGIEYTGV